MDVGFKGMKHRGYDRGEGGRSATRGYIQHGKAQGDTRETRARTPASNSRACGAWRVMDVLMVEAVVNLQRYADALIEIAAAFTVDQSDPQQRLRCGRCGSRACDVCPVWCPGLLARLALGVA